MTNTERRDRELVYVGDNEMLQNILSRYEIYGFLE